MALSVRVKGRVRLFCVVSPSSAADLVLFLLLWQQGLRGGVVGLARTLWDGVLVEFGAEE